MSRRLWLITLLLLLFQWYARYAAAPVVDFTLDDWSLLRRAENMVSYADAWRMMLQEPDRPVGALALALFFRAFGDAPACYNYLGYVANSLCLLAVIGIGWELTRNLYVVWLAGLLFSTFPILQESFNWPTMVCYGPGFAAVPASAYLWTRFVRWERWRDLAGAVFFYAIGLGNYELGIFLPATYLLLWCWLRPWRKGVWVLTPFGLVLATYLAWRFTRGFGLAQGVLFVPRTPSFSLSGMAQNARAVASWWAGGSMLDSFRNGWDGFAQMPLWARRGFFLGNFAAAGGAIGIARWLARKVDANPAGLCTPRQAAIWAMAWVLLAHSLNLVSWTAARLNLVPAFGMSLLLAVAISRFRPASALPVLAALVVAGLFSVQGTAFQWKQSGAFNRRLANHLADRRADWRGKEIVWFDTRALRSRVEQNLLKDVSENPATWAFYGNAGLLRGFALSAMIARLADGEQPPRAILDAEYGALPQGPELAWHERYDPSKPRRTPLENVYRVDCLAAAQGAD